jgi:hypothetical protein
MAGPKRLVLFVEGPGDTQAAPALVKHLLTELQAWEHVLLDNRPFEVGNVEQMTSAGDKTWLRLLRAASRRGNLGAVLLLLDGDAERVRGETFCPVTFGRRLAEWARQAGAGVGFSVACVFARMEYESWVIGCADHLAGVPLPDGRPGIKAGTSPPAGDLEEAPRDAKGWLSRHIEGGYRNTRDQLPLTQLMTEHLDALRDRQIRSFLRLDNALAEITEATRTGHHIVSPSPQPG